MQERANFLYISAADLIPELTEDPDPGVKSVLTITSSAGLALLLLVAVAM